jgi:hypothetical protein
MNGKFLLRTLLLEMQDKLPSSIFAATIRMKNFDIGFMLSLHFGFKIFVSCQGITFSVQKVEVGNPSFVIRKSNIVGMPTDC